MHTLQDNPGTPGPAQPGPIQPGANQPGPDQPGPDQPGTGRLDGLLRGAALVLEGGGMRGLYTTGVLDAFLDSGVHFHTVVGVSAGASHALSYLSRQKGRARRVNIDYCRRSDYMGLRCLLKEGSLFGMDLLFRKIPYEYDLFDFNTFFSHEHRYLATVTSLETGKAEYLEPSTPDEVLSAAMASCSLPFISKPVLIGGKPYLDGGIGDSIPVRKMAELGFPKTVVVLTQPAGYRKKAATHAWLSRAAYSRYPAFVRTLESRNERYNEVLDHVDALDSSGSAIVIRPQPQEGLDRLERDPRKLDSLHRSGYADAMARIRDIQEFSL